MFYLLPLRILYFPSYVEVSMNSKLEHVKKKKKKSQRFFKAYCVGCTNGTYSSAQMYFYLMFLPF